jgi:hypothetical protein
VESDRGAKALRSSMRTRTRSGGGRAGSGRPAEATRPLRARLSSCRAARWPAEGTGSAAPPPAPATP